MNKEEKKLERMKEEKEQKELEKKFHKTTIGKIIKTVFILSIIVFLYGLLSAFSYHIFNLDEAVFNIAGKCIEYGGEAIFFCMIVYCIFLAAWAENKKENKEDK